MEVAEKITLLEGGTCNTYLIDDKVKVLVDAGVDYQGKVDMIILTHGHHDHITHLNVIMERNPGCEVFICIKEIELLNSQGVVVDNRFKALYEGKTRIETGIYNFEVMEVPAHTKGSIALWDDNKKVLFSGDTIFKDGVGRTDFPESIPDFLDNATTLLLCLDSEIVLPGHGECFKPPEPEVEKKKP